MTRLAIIAALLLTAVACDPGDPSMDMQADALAFAADAGGTDNGAGGAMGTVKGSGGASGKGAGGTEGGMGGQGMGGKPGTGGASGKGGASGAGGAPATSYPWCSYAASGPMVETCGYLGKDRTTWVYPYKDGHRCVSCAWKRASDTNYFTDRHAGCLVPGPKPNAYDANPDQSPFLCVQACSECAYK